jgi:hypothetical protein
MNKLQSQKQFRGNGKGCSLTLQESLDPGEALTLPVMTNRISAVITIPYHKMKCRAPFFADRFPLGSILGVQLKNLLFCLFLDY